MFKYKRFLSGMFFLVGYVALTTVLCAGIQTGSFTIAAFNAEWLFDGVNDRFAPWTSPTAADAHLARIGSVIAALGADYVSLEEVEDARILGRLADLLSAFGYEQIFVQGRDTATGQDVAALSRIPPDRVGRTDARAKYPIFSSNLTCKSGSKGVSKNYWAELEIGVIPVTVIGVHFLAFPDRCDRAVKREAQALVIARLARDALRQGREVIVLGDMNDFDGTVLDASSDRPISIVLKTLKDPDPTRPGDELHNACDRIPQSERYTAWYDRNRNGRYDPGDALSQIDFILVSSGLYSRLTEVQIDHSAPPGWASDHWPVVVTFCYDEENIAYGEP
ncbi:MAG: endonuclease [Thermoplasmata archaeon]|nr:endonuclease/exonuclease/phosphatase family protein [Candidatus Bipolaricaulota bacterium]RLF62574.1 MAG: endonuclease [Thermoplasmata archaeon]